ncbi:hypothetical protein KKB28_03170, partial [bacterium]|nr:hypothetical protein [bacterium]
MARKSTESKSVSFEVVVELKELEKGQRLPNLAAYAFSPCGRFLAKQPLKPDPKKSGIGRAKFTIDTELDHLLVKVGVNVDDYRAAERHRAIANNLLVKEKKILDFEIPKDIWRCWLYVLYVITGTVTKPEGGWYNPICVGEVDVYEVDVKKCLIRLDDYLIEKIRDGLIDIIENPPREIEGFPPDIPWPSNGNDDDGWCGTKPPKPFPPRLVDVIKKLESLPSEWAFAKDRYIGLPTARTRMDAALNEMAVAEKRAYLDSEAAEGVKVSQILYTNTTQFRHLLVEKFQVLKYYLCWYPWIYWIWWPYCSYSAEKLGTTKLKMDGSFSLGVYLSVCEDDKPDLWFLVRQKISGIERIIYARYPVPCNTYWNHPSGKPVHLVVYDPEAVVCHPPPDVNIPGYWVMPMGIYEDEWWQVHQAHLSTACVPGTPLPSQCGLYNQTDPYGTRLDLRMEFHPGLRNCISATNGARYYRWSYRKHGNTTWIPINTHISHRYVAYIGSDWFIEREDMGPHTVGGKDNLFLVPDQRPWLHNRDDLACAIWYTAIWDSTLNRYVAQVTDGKYDLRLEMFDKNGNKLKPTTAGFKFCLPTSATGIVNDSLYVESDGS